MRYVIGLGNPGLKYEKTRHNFGFLCLEELSAFYGKTASYTLLEAQQTPVMRWEQWETPNQVKTVLVWPQTYMNLSGNALAELFSHFGPVPLEQLLVIIDDLSLPLGQVRLRRKGSSGGHNGLKSIEARLESSEYARLKLGIGAPMDTDEIINFVLSPFEDSEMDTVRAVNAFAALHIAEWVDGVSLESLMGKINSWRYEL